MSIDVGILIAVIGVSLSVGTFLIGRATANRKEGEEAGTMKADIAYIKENGAKKSDVDHIKETVERVEGRVERLDSRVESNISRIDGRVDLLGTQIVEVAKQAAGAEKTAKSAHKRLDEHLGPTARRDRHNDDEETGP